ncbi:MAG: GNAT family N-acetyltransferase [Ferruginibacter sp.]|nr:GNAT family N-acetyltransferase [Ferruginibacter sp.]
MQIETKRLRITPLNAEQLSNYCLTNFTLEMSLGANKINRIVPDFLKNVIKNKIIPLVNNKTINPLYTTFWTVIVKKENVMVADFCFKGEPNINGEIEIGYGTYPNFEGNGFMTESVCGAILWAFQQPNVTSILAKTDHTNIASQKILLKNKFKQYGITEENILWRIDK